MTILNKGNLLFTTKKFDVTCPKCFSIVRLGGSFEGDITEDSNLACNKCNVLCDIEEVD